MESHELSLTVWTLKATKPSPLNIHKPKKSKKKIEILDLTTPPPQGTRDVTSEMDMDMDTTPMTPICRSNPLTPVVTDNAPNQTPPPTWAQTPSPDDKTSHAPSFPPPAPALAPSVNSELTAIMAAITGMRTDLINRIENVNSRVDKVTAPKNIPDYIAWNIENTSTWEHPGYTDEEYNQEIEAAADANADMEVKHLEEEHFYHSLANRYITEKRINEMKDKVQTERWYDVCSGVFKFMSWTHSGDLLPEMNDTILNAWHCGEMVINEMS